jgi:DNA-binding PadR family transcriptional regulator
MTESTEIPSPRSPLWMVVLALACEEPMHPYRMQTLIKQRGKDQVANVAQRNSVYQTIDALVRAGLIRVRETTHHENRPERTVYEATERGREALLAWLRSALSTPVREYPMFPAALATLDPRLKPELRGLLEARLATLEARLPELEKTFPGLPRIFLIEDEYTAALMRAEIDWLRALLDDLRTGKLKFPTESELRRIATQMGPPSPEALRAAADGAASAAPARATSGRRRAGKTRRKGSS